MATKDESAIRDQIEAWVTAIREGDIETVISDRTDDVVMFDVPPPERGARGITEYRDTWPPFFEWIASGARFEIDELTVTAGEDVAFAHALLYCGRPEHIAENPDRRLRLTLGLRRQDGDWLVSHEHHSFTIEQE